jgi:hypothetical protein
MKSRRPISSKGMIKMTDTTCYDIEGIRVCVPDDTQKFANYALIGIAVLIGIAFLGYLAVDNASIIGTELMDESIYYNGF